MTRILNSAAFSAVISSWLLPQAIKAAYRQRGYIAFGGEWLIPVLLFIAAYIILSALEYKKEEGNHD